MSHGSCPCDGHKLFSLRVLPELQRAFASLFVVICKWKPEIVKRRKALLQRNDSLKAQLLQDSR